MSTRTKWSVWTKGAADQFWLEVVEGVSEKDAKDAVDRKTQAAAKFSVNAEFVALPKGETP